MIWKRILFKKLKSSLKLFKVVVAVIMKTCMELHVVFISQVPQKIKGGKSEIYIYIYLRGKTKFGLFQNNYKLLKTSLLLYFLVADTFQVKGLRKSKVESTIFSGKNKKLFFSLARILFRK